MTGCSCPDDGSTETRRCERHDCIKPAHFRKLCRTRPDYFQAWEEGRGPGQPIPEAEPVPEPKPRSRANDTAQRFRERRAVCHNCPENVWDTNQQICPRHAGNRCSMNKLLNSPLFKCLHWPE
jgi:hypothetical protein